MASRRLLASFLRSSASLKRNSPSPFHKPAATSSPSSPAGFLLNRVVNYSTCAAAAAAPAPQSTTPSASPSSKGAGGPAGKITNTDQGVLNTGSPIRVPVGRATLGCIMNVIGEPIDHRGDIKTDYPTKLKCPYSFVQTASLHNGMAHFAPRSFFGVEDFVDDDNSRPYTYQKEKKSKNPHKHVSFKQRTVACMEPFTLDVFISKRFVSASLTHRVTSKQVAVAGTNSKDIKAALKSRSDIPACLAIGQILGERAREADVYTASYTPRDRDKFEGKIRAVVQSLIDNGIDVKVYLD